jgi:transcriptional regulator with XRE-family HTH domain
VASLLRLSYGERVRDLRKLRGLRQSQLLELVAAALGEEGPPSVGWMSGIENGAFEPTATRRRALGIALGLNESEARTVLGTSENAGELASLDQQAYAAWQAVRLFAGEEHSRDRGDRLQKERGQAAVLLIREALIEDPDVYRASLKSPGTLGQFCQLPLTMRWMLVVEAAYMDPFLPLRPFRIDLTDNFTSMLERLCRELDIPYVKPVVDEVERAKGYVAWAKESLVLDKGHAPPPDRIFRAAGQLGESPSTRLIRGDLEVGTLGWWAACGLYLVTTIGTDASTAPQEKALGETALRLTFESGLPTAVPTAVAIHSGLRGRASGGRGRPAPDPGVTSDASASMFVASLGPRTLGQDLVKLTSLYQLKHIIENPPSGTTIPEGMWIQDGILPDVGIATERLMTLSSELIYAQNALLATNDSGIPFVKDLKTQADQLKDSAKKLSKLKS